MAGIYEYKQIKQTDKTDYKEFLPDEEISGGVPGDILVGINKDSKPHGAIVLQKKGEGLAVRSIRMADSPDSSNDLGHVLSELIAYAAKIGYKTIECRYTDDEPGITEQMLRDAGFTAFKEEAHVYRVDAYTLGSLLRDAPDARLMYESAVRIMSLGRVKCLSEADEDIIRMFENLYPDPDLSFYTTDDTGALTGNVVISNLPDGSPYLADLRCIDGGERDLVGLLFMAFGKTFMRIEPDGEFYIAAVDKSYRRLADYFFAPVFPLISVHRILNARKNI